MVEFVTRQFLVVKPAHYQLSELYRPKTLRVTASGVKGDYEYQLVEVTAPKSREAFNCLGTEIARTADTILEFLPHGKIDIVKSRRR